MTSPTEPELARAIRGDELVLYYQPKVDFRMGGCREVEALVRWQHPERGLVFPDDFIPQAESFGLIGELTAWVVREAVRQTKVWHDAGLFLTTAVNLSATSLGDNDLLAVFRSALEEFGVPPFSLEIEITESGVMGDPAAALEVLGRFDKLGIHAVIDDFGTGFSSLVYLRDLPLYALKIDKSFVMGMESNDRNRAIVDSTIALGHSLGLRVVAEGVEDEEAAHSLRAAGCDLGQGYLWSRPVPPDVLSTWLAQFDPGVPAAPTGPSRASREALAVAATQRMIEAGSPDAIRDILTGFVIDLGAEVVSAEEAFGSGVLQVDLSLGEGPALLPVAEAGSVARRNLDDLLPMLMALAQMMVERRTSS